MGFLLKLLGGVSKEEHEAELEKMKKLYHEQIEEIQTAFRAKTASLKQDLDEYKAQNNTAEMEAAHEAELEKMKKLYHEQIDEIQTAFQSAKASMAEKLFDSSANGEAVTGADHEEEMARMKSVYESMIAEMQEIFQEKLAQQQKELDAANEQINRFKTQLGSLLS